MSKIYSLNQTISLNPKLAKLTQSAQNAREAVNVGDDFWRGYGEVAEGGDSLATINTPYSMIVGQSFYGYIDSFTDSDWVAIQLNAGQSYDFRLLGFGVNFLSDPILRLYDSAGVFITSNDDGFTSNTSTHEFDSALTYTATSTGTYYLDAQNFLDATGYYLLSATQDVGDPILTVDEIAWQLINNGAAYFESPEGAAFNVGFDNTITVNIENLTIDGQFLAAEALDVWSAYTGINFQFVIGAAEITFDDNFNGAYAESVYSGTDITSSNVNIGLDWLASFGTTLESYSFETYLHEIGHAMGLAHGGNYNGSATFGVNNYYQNDSVAWSIMSYMNASLDELDNGNPGDWNTFVDASFRYMYSPMIADMIAMNYLYGAQTVFSGNTTWGFNANTGVAAFDQAVNSGQLMAMTVVDGGGTDMLDFSNTGTAQVITLLEESLSSVLGGRHNFGISRGSVIENARGGSGEDAIYGNAVANVLFGNNGADVLNGGNGADTLFGGLGGDTHIGGNDGSIDYARYDDANYGNLTIRLTQSNLNTGAAAGDTYIGIEGLVGGAGNDTISGDALANYLFGSGGTDVIFGFAGADYLNGGLGADNLYGGTEADAHIGGDDAGLDFARYDDQNYGNLTIRLDAPNLNTGAAAGDTYTGIEGLVGGAGNDTIYGNALANYLYGSDGTDSLFGQGGADYLNGGLGTNNLWGGAGADQHIGGSGVDYARYDEANWGNLTIRLDAPAANVGAVAVGDTYTGVEGLVGGLGNDTVVGNASSNYLFGGGGTDNLYGLGGNDFLNGGAGADRFYFTTALAATNLDTIADFVHLTDDIMLSQAIFTGIGATLDAAEFQIGAANTATDRILYNNVTGNLFYDSNGNGAGGVTQIASLTAGTVLTLADFIMV